MKLPHPRNETTVTDLSIGGALALILLWILGYTAPDFTAALPTGGEAAIALVITAMFSYIKEPKPTAQKG